MRSYRSGLLVFFVLIVICLPSLAPAAERLRAAYAALNASQSPLWIAQARGFYAKQGLDVELLHISSGSMNIQALVGGSIQFAAGGPGAVEARLRGLKLLIIANPLPVIATNLVSVSEIKAVGDLKGRIGGISRFGSSTDQAIQYLFRKAGLSPDADLKLLQLGGDANRLAALQIGKVQYTFLGGAASEQARAQGYKVLATAQQMAIPFPWTAVIVNEPWLNANRDVATRYLKAITEAIWFIKRNRAESERVIARYMKTSDAHVLRVEYDFNVSLLPDLPYPTLEGIRLILDNLARDNPEAARHDPREFVDLSVVDSLKRDRFLENLGK